MTDLVVPVARPLETRWPCPVCIGVSMEKKQLDAAGRGLTLDYCPRCGGIWFDRGEVNEIVRRDHSVVAGFVIDGAKRVKPPCHKCRTPLDRNAEKCPACKARNLIPCPVCDRTMERRPIQGLVLDVCKHCQGVWFDNAELTAIWRLNLAAATAKRTGGAGVVGGAGEVMLETMFWAPDLVFYGGAAAVEGIGAVAGAAAEASSGVFEAIVEIISGLFD